MENLGRLRYRIVLGAVEYLVIEEAKAERTAGATKTRARNCVLLMHDRCLNERFSAGVARVSFPIGLVLAPADPRGDLRSFFRGVSCTG